MITTAPYRAKDSASFLRLYRASMDHYDVQGVTPEIEARLLDLLARDRFMSCILAWSGDVAVGFATWGLVFPAGLGAALYLKELYIQAAARGTGAGRALIADLVRIAQEEGCTRIDWQADGDNPKAQRFYEAIGASAIDKISYRVNSSDFDAFLRGLGQPSPD